MNPLRQPQLRMVWLAAAGPALERIAGVFPCGVFAGAAFLGWAVRRDPAWVPESRFGGITSGLRNGVALRYVTWIGLSMSIGL